MSAPALASESRNIGAVPPDGAEQLRLARLVQEALLPPPVADLPGLEVAVRFLPTAQVGGDFLDYFPLGRRALGCYVGDVQGKGLEAAMYALLVSGLMRGLHKSGTDPADVVASLNRRLCFRLVPGKYCCLSYAHFEMNKKRLHYASAGLPFPLLLRGDTLSRIELTGHPVGMFNPCGFEQLTVSLRSGDRLLFYTDGLTDSLMGARTPWTHGVEQLEKLFRTTRRLSLSAQADRLLVRASAPAEARRTKAGQSAGLSRARHGESRGAQAKLSRFADVSGTGGRRGTPTPVGSGPLSDDTTFLLARVL
jgi:sigma-B regulation protein RsbU (phosphoserine phosphatase)